MKLEDKLIMNQYIRLTEFMGRLLGKDYEIVLHDLEDKEHSIVAIANNFISGRKVGGPITNVALQIISDKSYLSTDFRSHYSGVASDGTRLISSTMFIKNSSNELIGLLCVNFSDKRYRALSEKLLNLRHVDPFVDSNFSYNEEMAHLLQPSANPYESLPENSVETFCNTTDDVTRETALQTMAELNISAERLTADEKFAIVEKMNARGAFMLKGAVKTVADVLDCSQATIYRYLAEIREHEKNE